MHWSFNYEAEISIHALREESDSMASYTVGEMRISIHALREESDHQYPASMGI